MRSRTAIPAAIALGIALALGSTVSMARDGHAGGHGNRFGGSHSVGTGRAVAKNGSRVAGHSAVVSRGGAFDKKHVASQPPVLHDNTARACQRLHRSYDPGSNRYFGPDGRLHYCLM